MAIDTASKRASAVSALGTFMPAVPWPDGTVAQADRQHQVWTYSGILASAQTALAELFYLLSPVELSRSIRSMVELARNVLSPVADSFNITSEVD